MQEYGRRFSLLPPREREGGTQASARPLGPPDVLAVFGFSPVGVSTGGQGAEPLVGFQGAKPLIALQGTKPLD